MTEDRRQVTENGMKTPRWESNGKFAGAGVALAAAAFALLAAPARAQERVIIRKQVDSTERVRSGDVVITVDPSGVMRLVGELLTSRQMEERVALALREAMGGRADEARARELEAQLGTLARRSAGLLSTIRLQCASEMDQPEGYLGVSFEGIEVRREGSGPAMYHFGRSPRVTSVEPGSPAARAGLEAGDLIVAVAGNDVTRPVPLGSLLKPGNRVVVRVARAGRERDLAVTVAKRPDDYGSPCAGIDDAIAGARWAPQAAFVPRGSAAAAPRAGTIVTSDGPVVARTSPSGFAFVTPFATQGPNMIGGASLLTIDDEWRETLGVDRGLLVLAVAPGSPADASGLRKGDIVLAAGDSSVASTGALWRMVNTAGNNALTLKVQRARQPVTVVFRAREPR